MEEDYSSSLVYNGFNNDQNDLSMTEKSENGRIKQYSLEGIIDYLQKEWSKMEIERSRWDTEKVELESKISFLQDEIKGQEKLKRNLVRRIKMLEFALKQERFKSLQSKRNNQSGGEPGTPPEGYNEEEIVKILLTRGISKLDEKRWIENRDRLRRCLASIKLENESNPIIKKLEDILGLKDCSEEKQSDLIDTLSSYALLHDLSKTPKFGPYVSSFSFSDSNDSSNTDKDVAAAIAEIDSLTTDNYQSSQQQNPITDPASPSISSSDAVPLQKNHIGKPNNVTALSDEAVVNKYKEIYRLDRGRGSSARSSVACSGQGSAVEKPNTLNLVVDEAGAVTNSSSASNDGSQDDVAKGCYTSLGDLARLTVGGGEGEAALGSDVDNALAREKAMDNLDGVDMALVNSKASDSNM